MYVMVNSHQVAARCSSRGFSSSRLARNALGKDAADRSAAGAGLAVVLLR